MNRVWLRQNLEGTRGNFAVHFVMNPLQYLCKTLFGAQGYAVMILGLQYMNAARLANGVALYIAGVVLAALCGAVDSIYKAKVECHVRLRQKQKLLRTILYQKGIGQEHSTRLQDILITDVERIVYFFGTQINDFVTPLVVSLICILAVFAKSAVVAAIVLVSMLLTAVINLYFLPRLHAQVRVVREVENALTARYTDTIAGSAVIQVFSYQKYYLQEIGRQIQDVLDAQEKEVKLWFLQGVALNLLSFSSMTIPFLAGAVLTVKGQINFSTLMYMTQLSGNLLSFIHIFTGAVSELQRTRISKERIESVFADQLPARAECTGNHLPKECPQGSIAVCISHLNVTLEGRPVLKDISLEIPVGAHVAFVGESGCGKTTILKVLQNTVPYKGDVCFFGQCAESFTEQERYGLMSFVSQDAGLIDGTIYENIRIGKLDATHRNIEKAVQMAQVDVVVHNMENGLLTQVGENGSALSGGERQRITLARGFLKDASILLLDEVTSALDPATEDKIVDAVEQLRGTKTVIAVAQRLNTVRHMDKIFVLKDGALVGEGTYKELMHGCTEYQRLEQAVAFHSPLFL